MIVLVCMYSIIIVYALFIGWLSYGFKKVSCFSSVNSTPKQGFSIIIPFRNEESNLLKLLKGISQLQYPESLYEVLFINDSSEDASVTVITSYIKKYQIKNIKILDSIRVSHSPKKDAILTAIDSAIHSWIVTTDADCMILPLWLDTLDTFIQAHNSKLVAGPVTLPKHSSSFLQTFEQMDTLSLAGATIGGFGIKKPFLCNGAHLAYEKAAFVTVKGFEGNNHIASGDDHFMLEKFIKAFPNQIHYLKSKETIITTTFQENWLSFVRQRKRWAAKSTAYTNLFTKGAGLLIFLSNLTFVISVVFAFAKAYTNTFPFLILLLIKIGADSILIVQTSQFFSKQKLLIWYPICAILYPFISTYIAISSLQGGFIWKGRYFKR